MGRLIYSMFTLLDGYASDTSGNSDWGGATDAQLHDFVSEQTRSVGTYLYGRRMYDTMSYWETALDEPDQPEFVRRYAAVWQAASKAIYSTTLDAPTTARTTVERVLTPKPCAPRWRRWTTTRRSTARRSRRWRCEPGSSTRCSPYVAPVSVGGGLRFWPEGLQLDLELLDERRFANGTLWLRYAVRRD